jgi:hypothetical protein
MQLVLVLGALLILTPPAMASDRITFYLDGARVEHEITTARETLEVFLPPAVINDSLRVKPLDGCKIDNVMVAPAKPDPKLAKELARLVEKKETLDDRLKALDAREAIFKAAAKSQSGKAPRKTKTNPEPLSSVKQGTEYAISQLEEVYRARRKTENEKHSVDARLSALKSEGNVGGSVVKVRLTRRGGQVMVSYLRSDLRWAPAYDFRLDKAGEVDVIQRAFLPKTEKGSIVAVVPALISEKEAEVSVPSGNFPQVTAFTSPIEREQFSSVPLSSLTFSFRNLAKGKLPAGEASCYRRGEYLGKTAFGGAFPGEVKEIAVGN